MHITKCGIIFVKSFLVVTSLFGSKNNAPLIIKKTGTAQRIMLFKRAFAMYVCELTSVVFIAALVT